MNEIYKKLTTKLTEWNKLKLEKVLKKIVHYATSAMKRFLTSVSLQHEPKASDVITLVKKTFFARVSYEILYHEVWNKNIFSFSKVDFLLFSFTWKFRTSGTLVTEVRP